MYAIGSNSAKSSAELKALLSGGKHASRKLKRAQILLAADAGAGDEEIAASSRARIHHHGFRTIDLGQSSRRSTRRQRTTPCTAGSGPASTSSANSACCRTVSFDPGPGDLRSRSPASPAAL